MRRADETHEAIARADHAFARRQVDEDPTWMAHYDDAQHAGDTGAALADLVLAALDNPDRAAELPRLPDAAIEDACRRLEDASTCGARSWPGAERCPRSVSPS